MTKKLSGLKQPGSIPFRCWRPEVWSRFQWAEVEGSAGHLAAVRGESFPFSCQLLVAAFWISGLVAFVSIFKMHPSNLSLCWYVTFSSSVIPSTSTSLFQERHVRPTWIVQDNPRLRMMSASSLFALRKTTQVPGIRTWISSGTTIYLTTMNKETIWAPNTFLSMSYKFKITLK